MPNDAEWQASWSKLREKFEDWSLAHSEMRLCTRKIDSSLNKSELLHQLYKLAKPRSDILGNEQEGVVVQDALGMASSYAVGLQSNLSMEWWIASSKLADFARYGGEQSELNKLRAEAGSASEHFKNLAGLASLILSQRPKGVAIRYPWKEKGACDSRLWISLLMDFAEDFQHSTLQIAGNLPVFALGVLQPCDPIGLTTIDPDPGAASLIVLELIRLGDWLDNSATEISENASLPLSDNKQDILQSLQDANAVCSDNRKTASEVAAAVAGAAAATGDRDVVGCCMRGIPHQRKRPSAQFGTTELAPIAWLLIPSPIPIPAAGHINCHCDS